MFVYHHLHVWEHGDVTVVGFGEHRILDESIVYKISGELYGVANRRDCRKLLLNFSGVGGVSSLMLGKLLMLQRDMQSKGGKLSLCQLCPEVREVFTTTRLDRIFDIQGSQEEAIRALAGSGEEKPPPTSEGQ